MLFVYSCNIFSVIDPAYMLDSALESSYNLSKNRLLMPWILKLMVDMVNYSTPLNMDHKIVNYIKLHIILCKMCVEKGSLVL